MTPSRLSKITDSYTDVYINGNVSYSKIGLNMGDHFPYITLNIDSGAIVSYAHIKDNDTLLYFKKLSITINPLKLLSSTLSFRHIDIEDLHFNGIIAKEGRANWDIIKKDTTDTTQSTIGISINNINITKGANISYTDHQTAQKYNLSVNSILFDGHITDDMKDLKIKEFSIEDMDVSGEVNKEKLSFKSFADIVSIKKASRRELGVKLKSKNSIRQDTIQLCENLPVELDGKVKFDSISAGLITLDDLTLKISDIASKFSGDIILLKDSIYSDITCSINPLSVSTLLSLIPEEIAPYAKNLKTDISIDFCTTLKGSYIENKNIIPAINLDFKINKGYLSYEKTRARLDTMICDISMSYNPKGAKTKLDVRKFIMIGSGINLSIKGVAHDILTDPLAKVNIACNIDLKTLSDQFLSEKNFYTNGKLGFSMNAELRQSWLNIKNIGHSTIEGRLTFTDANLISKKDSLQSTISGGISFGSMVNKSDSLLGIDSRIIGISTLIDTMYLNLPNHERLTIANLKMSAKSASSILSGDTTEIIPMNGNISTARITYIGMDSTIVHINNLNGGYAIASSEKDVNRPYIKSNLQCDMIYLRNSFNRYIVKNSLITLHSILNNTTNTTTRREQRLDSLQKIYPNITRDSLFAYARSQRVSIIDDFKAEDIDISVSESIGSILRRWDTNGTIKASNANIITPYLPLKNRVKNLNVQFTQNEINIINTEFTTGDSQVNINAKISNITRAVTRGGKLRISSTITSDSMNFSQINQAIYNGSKLVNEKSALIDSLTTSDNTTQVEKLIRQSNTSPVEEKLLIIIPGNIDMNLHVDIDKCKYETLLINCLKADLIAKDRRLQIKDLTADTDIGNISLTAIYTTKSKTELNAGFDIDMKSVAVGRLMSVMPQMDSLLPMLKSFDGIIDCQMAATTAIDTSMNIILPTLNAACKIEGENMVLLDGETFSEIAKNLRFKNKDRNIIEKISVQLLVRDNKIEIFPFITEIDRYQTAISGIHNLDLTYEYHISVLRSPLPFRIGIDVKGNIDDFKYKLTRARFKSPNIPSYVGLIDTTRINLRERIESIFRNSRPNISLKDFAIIHKIDSSAIIPPEEPLTAADSLAIEELKKLN